MLMATSCLADIRKSHVCLVFVDARAFDQWSTRPLMLAHQQEVADIDATYMFTEIV